MVRESELTSGGLKRSYRKLETETWKLELNLIFLHLRAVAFALGDEIKGVVGFEHTVV